MLRLFATQLWNSSDRRVRSRLFRYLGESDSASLVYADRGPERFLVHCRDSVIGREVFLSGQYEFDKVTAALALLKRHAGSSTVDLLVDVGANIGTVSIPAVARGLAKAAVAIEPDPTNCRLLRVNAILNGVESRLTVHECALGEREGDSLLLEQSPDNRGDHRVAVSDSDGDFGEASRQRIRVASTRLDRLVPPPSGGTRVLVWMDTQGYEGFVLKGATSLLNAGFPVVSEFWPYGMKRSASFPAFRESVAGYRGFADLNAGASSGGDLRPIGELDDLFVALDTGMGSYTDILIV